MTVRKRFARPLARATLAVALAGIGAGAAHAEGAAAPAPSPFASGAIPDLYVRGNLLAIDQGYLFFTTGNAVRLAPGVTVPRGVPLGHSIRITLDQTTHAVKAIDGAPTTAQPGEIDASQLPSQYAVLTPAAPAASTQIAAGSANGGGAPPGPTLGTGPVTVQFNVTVPGNTPPNDDIYIATDRSNFSPSEIHMTRSDPQHWTASLTLPGGSAVHYEYTRGTYATVERDRFGGIIAPRGIPDAGKIDDTIARWADLN